MIKKWYESKLVWAGVIITFQGCVPIVAELLERGDVKVSDVLVALSGIGTIILRIWFTDSAVG